MADPILKSKITFGDSDSVEAAKTEGKINEFDILCLDGATKPKIGWIDREGNTRIVKNQDVVLVTGDALPESGEDEVIYIFNNSLYYWDGTNFVSVSAEGVSEDVVDTKIENVLTEANTYTDQKISEIVTGYEIVEF